MPAIGFSTGSALANASGVPPAMKVSVPAAAPAVPPDTGASIDSRPCLAAIACAWRAESTSIVEQSMSSEPARGARRDLRIDGKHMLAGRQHGDDGLGAIDGSGGVGHDGDAVVARQRQVLRDQVEALHRHARP